MVKGTSLARAWGEEDMVSKGLVKRACLYGAGHRGGRVPNAT